MGLALVGLDVDTWPVLGGPFGVHIQDDTC